MKLIYKALLGATLMASPTLAQAAVWSLDSCISYAHEHNLQIKLQQQQVASSELAVTEAKDRFLPSLSASAAQNWDFGRGLTSQNTYANRNTAMTSGGIQFQLPLFQGLAAIRQLRQSQAQLTAQQLEVAAAKDEVTLGVMSYYLQALFNTELQAVAAEELRLSKTQLERQQSLFEAGKVPEVDVLQARAQVAKGEMNLVTSANDRRVSLLELAKALELPDPKNFEIQPLEANITAPIPSEETVLANALSNYNSIRAARSAISTADLGILTAQSGYLPKLYLTAGLNSSYYNLAGTDNPGFGKQMRDNFSRSIGFSMQIPIFDAFSTRNNIRRARQQKSSAELELERRTSELTKNIRQATLQATGAQAKYTASVTAVDAAKAALDAMTEKYTYGKANATEWEQTRSTYTTTLSQQVQAKYELILRKKILDFYNR